MHCEIYTYCFPKKKNPPPGSLSLSNAYTSHLEGGLRLALYDSLFIWGVLAYRALWRYNPHYTRLIPPPPMSAPGTITDMERQKKVIKATYKESMAAIPVFRMTISYFRVWDFTLVHRGGHVFFSFVWGEKKELSGAKENRHKGTYISCNPL